MRSVLLLIAAMSAGCFCSYSQGPQSVESVRQEAVQKADSYEQTVNVEEAGTLASLIDESQKYQLTSLKITGEINGDDVKFIRDMAGVSEKNQATPGLLSRIDFSEVRIVAGGGVYTTNNDWDELTTEDNVFPEHFFGAGRSTGCSVTEIILPTSITKIGAEALQNCASLTSIVIPENVTEIGKYAFSGSGLTSAEIPSTVTKIGEGVFFGCQNLKSVTLPDNLTEIPTIAFSQTGLTEIVVPDAVESLGMGAFQYSSALQHITLSKNLKHIYSNAFNQCSALEEIELPEGLLSIGEQVFCRCDKLTSLHIPASVNEISVGGFSGNAIFSNYAMKEFTVDPANETYKAVDGIIYTKDGSKIISCPTAYEFSEGKLVVPEGVKEISTYAFHTCLYITDITLPSSLETLGHGAFASSANVMKLTCNAVTPPAVSGYGTPFGGFNTEVCELWVPEGSEQAYREAEYWSDFTIVQVSGVDKVAADRRIVERYDISGRVVDETAKGLQIVKYDDGTVDKIVVKD